MNPNLLSTLLLLPCLSFHLCSRSSTDMPALIIYLCPSSTVVLAQRPSPPSLQKRPPQRLLHKV